MLPALAPLTRPLFEPRRAWKVLVSSLPRALMPHASGMLQPLGGLLLSTVRAHELEMHGGGGGGGAEGGGDGAYDSDGGALGTGALISGILDVFSGCAARYLAL